MHAIVNDVASLKPKLTWNVISRSGEMKECIRFAYASCVVACVQLPAAPSSASINIRFGFVRELEHCFTFAYPMRIDCFAVCIYIYAFCMHKIALENSFPLYVELNAIFFKFGEQMWFYCCWWWWWGEFDTKHTRTTSSSTAKNTLPYPFLCLESTLEASK